MTSLTHSGPASQDRWGPSNIERKGGKSEDEVEGMKWLWDNKGGAGKGKR